MPPERTLILSVTASAVLIASAALSQTADGGGRKFNIALTGEAEVTPTGTPNQGDLDGTGTAKVTVNVGQSRICYELEVDGISEATAAHIHAGHSATTGPPVVTLDPPKDGDSSGCLDISKELAKQIISDPANYYVNVHNADFPGGALRGQFR